MPLAGTMRLPVLLEKIFPSFVWRVPVKEKILFLTFDDGPMPGITDWVLDKLKSVQAKATFFCVGKNAEQHPELMKRIAGEGHAIGNHTHQHLNGWDCNAAVYLKDVEQCAGRIHPYLAKEKARKAPLLFRP